MIATFLLIQDLSRNEHFKFDKGFSQKLAAHILADKNVVSSGKSTSGTTIAGYYESWRLRIVGGIGIHLDPKRLFDERDKDTIYTRDQGNCRVCGDAVDPAVAEYDHYPIPHTLGGGTVPENGRLVHAACHPRGPITDPDGD